MTNPEDRRLGVRVIAVVNAVSAVVTVAFWGLVYIRLFGAGTITDPVVRASAAATLGFLVGDVVWALPLLIVSVAGLWRRRLWGWLSAQLVNVLWVYSMTVVWVRDVYAGSLSPGAVLFAPFTLFAFWATVYLWRSRDAFSAGAVTVGPTRGAA
jgi:hypothetical protein